MAMELKSKNACDLFPTDILFQTAFWGRFKKRLGWKPMAFDVDDPHLDPATAFIRYDLPWVDQYDASLNPHTGDEKFPQRPEPRLRELRMNFGTRNWNLKKTAFDFSVADTLIIDITRKKEDILARMKSKTRYNIRLSQKKGVRVFTASLKMLPVFYDLHVQTARRNRFTLCDDTRFSSLFTAIDHSVDSTKLVFLLAGYGKDILAGAILGITEKTAFYLFGASSNRYRNFMAPYGVHQNPSRLRFPEPS